jgi:hypothetical protein
MSVEVAGDQHPTTAAITLALPKHLVVVVMTLGGVKVVLPTQSLPKARFR